MKRGTIRKQLREKKLNRKKLSILRRIISQNGACSGIQCSLYGGGGNAGINCPLFEVCPCREAKYKDRTKDEDYNVFKKYKFAEAHLELLEAKEKLKFLENL